MNWIPFLLRAPGPPSRVNAPVSQSGDKWRSGFCAGLMSFCFKRNVCGCFGMCLHLSNAVFIRGFCVFVSRPQHVWFRSVSHVRASLLRSLQQSVLRRKKERERVLLHKQPQTVCLGFWDGRRGLLLTEFSLISDRSALSQSTKNLPLSCYNQRGVLHSKWAT